IVAACPSRMRLVCAATAVCTISGLGLISAPSGWKWCSVIQNDWKPSFSARIPCRTWLTSVSCAARWTSSSEPLLNVTPSLPVTIGRLQAPFGNKPISNIDVFLPDAAIHERPFLSPARAGFHRHYTSDSRRRGTAGEERLEAAIALEDRQALRSRLRLPTASSPRSAGDRYRPN